MFRQILLASALLAGIPALAMERVIEMPVMKEGSSDDEKVTISLSDETHADIMHEVEISLQVAKYVGALKTFVESSDFERSPYPLANVTYTTWRLIEPWLEKLSDMVHDDTATAYLCKEIVAEYGSLESKALINLIRALDFIDVPILFEIAVKLLLCRGLKEISYEDVASLPGDLCNRFILQNIISVFGALRARELVVCSDHQGAHAVKVCIAPDGKHIVSGSWDGTVRVRDMQGKEVAVGRGHEGAVYSVCITPDGKHIVSGSLDKTVRIWDMQGNEVVVCKGHKGPVGSVCITSDGKHIVSGSYDKTVRVWDMQGKEVAVCRGHKDSVNSVCVTPDGKHIVSGSGSYDSTVRVWDMGGNEVAVCRGHENTVLSVCVTPDGKHIVSGSLDKTVRLWDMHGHEVAVCRGHEDYVRPMCLTHDGKHIVSGSNDKTVRVWDIQGKEVAVFRGHESPVTSVCVTLDGKHIVSGSHDGRIRVSDMQNKEIAVCLWGHLEYVVSLCIARHGKHIVSGAADGTVRIWDIGLLDRILHMSEDQASVLWDYVLKLLLENDQQMHWKEQQQCWKEIEAILEKVIDQNSIENSE